MVACSLIAVVWQLGLLPFLGYELDPYSILVPFPHLLHRHESRLPEDERHHAGYRSRHPSVVGCALHLRRLFLPGSPRSWPTPWASSCSFAIRIQVIQDWLSRRALGWQSYLHQPHSLLPICLSFTGVNPKAALRSLSQETAERSGAEKNCSGVSWTSYPQEVGGRGHRRLGRDGGRRLGRQAGFEDRRTSTRVLRSFEPTSRYKPRQRVPEANYGRRATCSP